MTHDHTSPELLEALSLDVGPLTLARWVRSHYWAVTTEDDCWGHPPGSTEPERYALYDADADEPPVAVFASSEDAERVAAALNAYGELTAAIEQAETNTTPAASGEGGDR